jgi:hypothetical protein
MSRFTACAELIGLPGCRLMLQHPLRRQHIEDVRSGAMDDVFRLIEVIRKVSSGL